MSLARLAAALDRLGWVALALSGFVCATLVIVAMFSLLPPGRTFDDWLTYVHTANRLLSGDSIYAPMQLGGPYALPNATLIGYAYPPSSVPLFFPFLTYPVGLVAWLTLNVGLLVTGLLAVLKRELGSVRPLEFAVALFGLALIRPFWEGVAIGNASVGLAGVFAWIATLFVDPRLWMAVAAMVLYLPLERSLATWADRYLSEMHYDADMIPRFLAGFWIAFVSARLGAALVVQPGFEMWLVFVLVVTAASTLGNLVGFYGSARGGRGFFVIGACFGPIFPTFLGVILFMFPQAPATVLGIVLGLGFLGNALFQPALVAFARSHTIQATVRIPMLAALLLAAPTLMLALIWWPGG